MSIYHHVSLIAKLAFRAMNDGSLVLAKVILQSAILHSYPFDRLYALKPKNPV